MVTCHVFCTGVVSSLTRVKVIPVSTWSENYMYIVYGALESVSVFFFGGGGGGEGKGAIKIVDIICAKTNPV